ncbi:hypothetical protein ACL9RI_10635 [Janthinobacterium sp. Mn2066]|uniref:hypothetical protein n=1 Tax=Janthinobacterium sp. Mn2066 TaxID=3395264 RepID=UPI003BD31D22
MKGGITSGVIYPKLIARLASKYTFKNIGGTSAGAIAAGACAAAEYGRSHSNPTSFDTLAKLPEWLGEVVTADGRSKLFSLFQPSKELRQCFSVLVQALNKPQQQPLSGLLFSMLNMHAAIVAACILLGSLLLWPFFKALNPNAGILAIAPLALSMKLLLPSLGAPAVASAFQRRWALVAIYILALFGLTLLPLLAEAVDASPLQLIATALSIIVVELLFWMGLITLLGTLFAQGMMAGLHKNGYGLCSGHTPEDASSNAQEGLTNWLTSYFNSLAGLDPDGSPLTFGDLWGQSDPAAPRAIHLAVMTTAVSQKMAYEIPFRTGTPPFYYDPQEWESLFPPAVMQHLNKHKSDSTTPYNPVFSPAGVELRPLPRQSELPVVVAVRMSLSFPVLLSAVPLYAVDRSLQENIGSNSPAMRLRATRVWFSDGGISSNMPLHMFDSILPDHPTFAINLKPAHPDYPITEPEQAANDAGRIYLAEDNRGGRQRHWASPDDQTPFKGLLGFFGDIINTMQCWRDEIIFPYAGFRDRIVQISQKSDEGGLNLDMPAASIEALSAAGEMAADRLIDRFHASGTQNGEGWKRHREARLKSFLGTMQPATTQLAPTLEDGGWDQLLAVYQNNKEKQLAKSFLDGIIQLGQLGPQTEKSLDLNAPKPLPVVRISPEI